MPSKLNNSLTTGSMIAFCLLFQASQAIQAASAADGKETSTGQQGQTRLLHGQINAFGAACVSSGVTPQSTQLPTLVEGVQKGSPAFYAGVSEGDKILSASIENNIFSLKIERNGRVYLARMQASLDNSKTQTGNDPVLTTILRSYDIKLIVDHSGSMYRPLGHSEKTRWDWVKEQLSNFCQAVDKKSRSTFDLFLFNETVQTGKKYSAYDVTAAMNDAVTTGSTNLPAALRVGVEGSSKPLLIILITDGQTVSSRENAEIIVSRFAASPTLRKSKIVFLQAGYSEEGLRFIASLKSAMKKSGMDQGAIMLLFEETADRGILSAIEPYLKL